MTKIKETRQYHEATIFTSEYMQYLFIVDNNIGAIHTSIGAIHALKYAFQFTNRNFFEVCRNYLSKCFVQFRIVFTLPFG